MLKAYGEPLASGVIESDLSDSWYNRWLSVVQLSGKLYSLPGGAKGRKYVDHLSNEISYFASGTYSSERLLVFSSVILQRDRTVHKGSDIRRVIERRLDMWDAERYDVLVQEAVRCDKLLKTHHKRRHTDSHITSVFTRLMLQGKVRAAIKWLTDQGRGRVFNPNDSTEEVNSSGHKIKVSVMDVLRRKHPEPTTPPSSALIDCDNLPFMESVEITGSIIQRIATIIQGSAGPGGCDANHWQDALLRYGAHSAELRESVASAARRLANNLVSWPEIRCLMASRLVALDKCPGVRPIGIGETLRRLIGKAVGMVTRYDVEEVCGTDQLCAGMRAGIEGAVHAIKDMFDEHKEDGWGVLLVDATNAFNSINRRALLWNARVLWPRCSRFLFNTYRGWAPLILKGSPEILYSREGVTQGDPLSMFLYAVGTLPLIRSIRHPRAGSQVWYADDASACAELPALCDWFHQLLEVGPKYGYFPEPKKSFIVVDDNHLDAAHKIFDDLGVRVVTGHRLLGGVIGCEERQLEFVKDCVSDWSALVDRLTVIAKEQPQVAYSALTRSIQNKWTYIQRLVSDCGHLFDELESKLAMELIPTLFGCEVSTKERIICSLPTRLGGLNIQNPTMTGDFHYQLSRRSTEYLIESLKRQKDFTYDNHMDTLISAQDELFKIKEQRLEETFTATIEELDKMQQRAIKRAKDSKISLWLNVVPISQHQYDLSAQEFRDALAIRYRKPLLNIPAHCDGCGSPFDLSHALSCRKGGLVVQRHNEIRDTFGDLTSLVWGQVCREPVVREMSTDSPALIADLAVRGAWTPQTEALFDIRVVDTDAQSYLSKSPPDVLVQAEREKKAKYQSACEERRAIFTPLCISVDGLMGKEATCFVKRIGDGLSLKWNKPYSEVVCWLRTRLSFAIIRASILCLRGARSKWRSINTPDGATLDYMLH